MTHLMQETFSGYGYVILSPGESPSSAENSFGKGWHEKYFSERLYTIDPIFAFHKQCGGRSGAKLLSIEEMNTPLHEEARAYGADSNFISVSAIGCSLMVFGGVNHDLDERAVPGLHRSCQAAHRTVLLKRIDGLSDTQIDFMEMCEEGLLDKQIASELGVSPSAVAQRKKAICVKVGTGNFRTALSLYSVRKWSGVVPLL